MLIFFSSAFREQHELTDYRNRHRIDCRQNLLLHHSMSISTMRQEIMSEYFGRVHFYVFDNLKVSLTLVGK